MYICGASHCEGLWEPGEVDRGRLLPPHLLADQLILSQLGGAVDYIHFILRAPYPAFSDLPTALLYNDK